MFSFGVAPARDRRVYCESVFVAGEIHDTGRIFDVKNPIGLIQIIEVDGPEGPSFHWYGNWYLMPFYPIMYCDIKLIRPE